jgi:hypothetical protein
MNAAIAGDFPVEKLPPTVVAMEIATGPKIASTVK